LESFNGEFQMRLLDTRDKLKKAIMNWYKIKIFGKYRRKFGTYPGTKVEVPVTYKTGKGHLLYTTLYELEYRNNYDKLR